MKTTLNLPDDLAHVIEALARSEGRSLNEVAVDAVRCGLTGMDRRKEEASGARVILPLVECEHTAVSEMSPDQIADILLGQEVATLSEASRH